MNPVPADQPVPLLETMRFFVSGKGADPYERQRRLARRRDEATATVLARLDPARAKAFRRLVRWAQRVAPMREDALADVGLAWPELRRMLAEVGRRLQRAGVINEPDDVFWLQRSEINEGLGSLADQVAQRKQLWRGQRRATPPQLLPKGGWGDMWSKWMPAASEDQTGDVIKGIAGSAGTITAPARVLGGPQDFGQMQPGDVLVASITTPAWTSLFAMASGVVTDIGGPLSHSSIVAREYGIPARAGYRRRDPADSQRPADPSRWRRGDRQSRSMGPSNHGSNPQRRELAASQNHRCNRRRCRCRWTHSVAGATPQVTQAELSL